MGIYAKLGNIQRQLFVPKENNNSFGKYNYRSCEDILKKAKPLCAENGCVLYISNELECIGERNYVKAIVTLVDLETGEEVVSTAHAREEETKKGMDGSQITGASSSYARKYALAGLFGIDNEQDSDATNKGDSEPTRAETVAKADIRAKAFKELNKHNKEYIAKVCEHYKIDSIQKLTAEQAENYLKCMEDKKK